MLKGILVGSPVLPSVRGGGVAVQHGIESLEFGSHSLRGSESSSWVLGTQFFNSIFEILINSTRGIELLLLIAGNGSQVRASRRPRSEPRVSHVGMQHFVSGVLGSFLPSSVSMIVCLDMMIANPWGIHQPILAIDSVGPRGLGVFRLGVGIFRILGDFWIAR